MGVSFAAKRVAPTVPLWVLFILGVGGVPRQLPGPVHSERLGEHG
jgi:hypothetical protein